MKYHFDQKFNTRHNYREYMATEDHVFLRKNIVINSCSRYYLLRQSSPYENDPRDVTERVTWLAQDNAFQ